MNKLKLFTGGFLLRNDDFDFLQKSYGGAFEGIIWGLCQFYNGYLILSGCDILLVNSSNGIDEYDVSEGYIIYNYEILHVPIQQSVGIPTGASLSFVLDVYYAASGTRTYANQQVHESHEVRQAIVQEYQQGVGMDVAQFQKLSNSVEKLLIETKQTLDITQTVTFQNGWSNSTIPIIFNKEASLKCLRMNLIASQNFINAQASTQNAYREPVCTIPLAYAPERSLSFWAVYSTLSIQGPLRLAMVLVQIQTGGEVFITKINDDQNQVEVEIYVNYL